MLKKMIFIAFAFLLLFTAHTLPTLADSATSATITKTTILTDEDAQAFSKIFGKELTGDEVLSFKCTERRCRLVATKAGFSGPLAEKLLNGRLDAKYMSENKKFYLNCGHTSVAFCNVTQKDAVLFLNSTMCF